MKISNLYCRKFSAVQIGNLHFAICAIAAILIQSNANPFATRLLML